MPRKFTFTTQVYDKRTDFPATGDVDVIYIDASKNTAYRYDLDYYTISSAEVDIWGALGSVSKGGGGGGGASWGNITGTLSSQTDLQTALDTKQDDLVSGTNIKTINGSSVLGSGNLVLSGGGGIHALVQPRSGQVVSAVLTGSAFNTVATTPNRLTAQPFIPSKTFTTANLYINVSTLGAGVNGRILIYSDLNGIPNTKLYESADLNLSTNGNKIAITTFTFNAGTTYWLCTHCSGTANLTSFPPASVIAMIVSGTSNVPSYIYNITYGSAPSILSGQANSVTAIPAVFITAA